MPKKGKKNEIRRINTAELFYAERILEKMKTNTTIKISISKNGQILITKTKGEQNN